MWSREPRGMGLDKNSRDSKETQKKGVGAKKLVLKGKDAVVQGFRSFKEGVLGGTQGTGASDAASSPVSEEMQRSSLNVPASEAAFYKNLDHKQFASSPTNSPTDTPRSVLSPKQAPQHEHMDSPHLASTHVSSPEKKRSGFGAAAVTDRAQVQASGQASEVSSPPPFSPPARIARSILSPDRSTAASRARSVASPPSRTRVMSPETNHRGLMPDRRAFVRQQGAYSHRDPGVLKQRRNAVKEANSIEKQLQLAVTALQRERQMHAQDMKEQKDAEREAMMTLETAVVMLENLKMEHDLAVNEAQVLKADLEQTRAKAAEMSEMVNESATMSPSRDPVFLEKKVVRLSKDLEELSAEKALLEDTAASLKDILTLREAQIAALVEDNSTLKSAADTALAQFNEVSDRLKEARLAAKKEATNAQSLALFRTRCEALAADVQRLEGIVARAAETSLNEQKAALERTQEQHAAEMTEAYLSNARLSDQLSAAKKTMALLHQEKEELFTELTAFRDGTIEDVVETQRSDLRHKEIELEQTKNTLDAIRKELVQCHEQLGGWSQATKSGAEGDDLEDFEK